MEIRCHDNFGSMKTGIFSDFTTFALFLIILGCSHPQAKVEQESKPVDAAVAFALPSGETQRKMVLSIRDEMIRLDGEGLLPRKNRPESFKKTTDQLAKEALQNQTSFDFYRTFSRLDATYPNLHAHVNFLDSLKHEIKIPGPGNMDWVNVRLNTEILTPFRSRTVLREITDDEKLSKKWEGAEVISINGISLKKWKKENFIFCKWALRPVCDRTLEENLLNGILLWKGGPLVYTVTKNGEKTDLTVHFTKPPTSTLRASSMRLEVGKALSRIHPHS